VRNYTIVLLVSLICRHLLARTAELERSIVELMASALPADSYERQRVQIEQEWDNIKEALVDQRRELGLRIQSLRENVLGSGEIASDDLDSLSKMHICMLKGTWHLEYEKTHEPISECDIKELVHTR
jgi:hypothetical protein